LVAYFWKTKKDQQTKRSKRKTRSKYNPARDTLNQDRAVQPNKDGEKKKKKWWKNKSQTF
jgi:hypothetical protein